MLRTSSIALALALAFSPGCKGQQGSASTDAGSVPSTSASVAGGPPDRNVAIADAQLAGAITESLGVDPVLRAQPVHASVADGGVTLTGTVRTLADKMRATRLVADFKGAVEVTDAILVKPSGRADAEIAKDVSDVIKSDPATRQASVQASASAGTVTLSGAVDSYAQRDLVVEDASRVPGVQAVRPALTIARVSARPDAEIATDVVDGMRDDARLDGTHVEVAVHAGSAVLSGVVGSIAQRDAAVEDAWNAGATGVDARAVSMDWLENTRTRPPLRFALRTDADVAKGVDRVLSNDPRVGEQMPSVHVEHGVVTLSGNVVDFRAERAAHRDARRVSGRRVEDSMTVLPAKRESDTTIQRQVLRGIYEDVASPDSHDVQVTTLNGRVTLRGAVASLEDKKNIEGDVEEVPGVVAIDDELRVPGYVPQTVVVAPETIRHRVIEAIFWDPRVPGGKVTVEVDPSGGVTLNGQVDSQEDAQAAEDDAIRAGAAHVLNYLRVASGP